MTVSLRSIACLSADTLREDSCVVEAAPETREFEWREPTRAALSRVRWTLCLGYIYKFEQSDELFIPLDLDTYMFDSSEKFYKTIFVVWLKTNREQKLLFHSMRNHSQFVHIVAVALLNKAL